MYTLSEKTRTPNKSRAVSAERKKERNHNNNNNNNTQNCKHEREQTLNLKSISQKGDLLYCVVC